MGWWICFVFSVLLISWVKSEEINNSGSGDYPISICGSQECDDLRNRLETLEAAVKTIVSALATQKNRPFAPITAILESDPALRFFLPPLTGSAQNTTQLKEDFVEQEKTDTVSQLKGSIKCSIATLLDINSSVEAEINPSGKIQALLLANNSLEIKWTPLSNECLEFNSGIWIRVLESGQQQSSLSNSYLTIPQNCLTLWSDGTHSIILHSPTTFSNEEENKTCRFELTDALIQCLSYTVEVIPNYQSLKGKSLKTKIIIPSANHTLNTKSLTDFVTRSETLTLGWKDNSGCSPQLTSFNLKIFPDGKVKSDATNATIKIPRSCLNSQPAGENVNQFSLTLSSDPACPIQWKPLDACRKYTFETTSEYSDTWTDVPSLWTIFTEKTGSRPQVKAASEICTAGKFYCEKTPQQHNRYSSGYGYENYGKCHAMNLLCDGKRDCQNGIDEQNCIAKLEPGFQCDRQRISLDKVCNGEYDCFDGTDEHYDCDYSRSCDMLTTQSGNFSPQMIDYYNEGTIEMLGSSAKKSIIFISVQANYTIWLVFTKFSTKENHLVKVYDGPYSTSPLLLSQGGSIKPPSIRSSYNELYLEIPSYYNKKTYSGVEFFYMSLENTGKPFVSGCGGYLYSDGLVSSPMYPYSNSYSATTTANWQFATVTERPRYPSALMDTNQSDNCSWYVEAARNEENAILLKWSDDIQRHRISNLFPYVTIYDGWSLSDRVLYDLKVSSPQLRNVVYSTSKRIMILLRAPEYIPKDVQIPTTKCSKEITGEMTGTIKSPNYPLAYPNLADCRWNITTKPGSKIRLLFALFETQEGFDYVYVYDGPTMNSTLLFEKTGSSLIPFTVNSSSNQMLIRFTSDESSTLAGFLAVYSTV